MNARREHTAGEICRVELQANDVAAARTFYGGLFGWRFEDRPAPGGRSCSQAFLDDDAVAVIAPQNPQQEAVGAPGQWSIYFAADDAQAMAEEAPHAGGTVLAGSEAVAEAGVVAFLVAPGGGTTGIWQAGTHPDSARRNAPGALAWAELRTPEPQAATGFFQQLFGHGVTEYPQDDGGTYTTLMVDGAEVAGIAPLAADSDGTGGAANGGAGWQVYFGVLNVAAAVDTAVAAGAVVLLEPEAAPEESDGDSGDAGVIATLQDPQGAVFSLVQV